MAVKTNQVSTIALTGNVILLITITIVIVIAIAITKLQPQHTVILDSIAVTMLLNAAIKNCGLEWIMGVVGAASGDDDEPKVADGDDDVVVAIVATLLH